MRGVFVGLLAVAAAGPLGGPGTLPAMRGDVRVRSLSPHSAAVACLFLQSYAEEKAGLNILPLSTVAYLLSCSRWHQFSTSIARFHLLPMAQGVVVASVARAAARILYTSFVEKLFSPQKSSLYATANRARRALLQAPVKAVGVGARATRIAGLAGLLQRRGGVTTPASMPGGVAMRAPSATAAPASPMAPKASAVAREPPAPSSTAGATALAPSRRKRALILMSDTGGGHRASAQALADTLKQRYGTDIETSIVDVWTDYGPVPIGNGIVPYYRGLAKRPRLWHAHFKASAFTPFCYLLSRLMSVYAYRGFEQCIDEHEPDIVVSMHPLCQAVPIRVLEAKRRRERGRRQPGAPKSKVPFVTVVTDLATPHPFWLHAGADLCFVPSTSFERAGRRRGLRRSKLRLYGLPVRPAFAESSARANSGPEQRAELAESLGLKPHRKTVLIVGGGDGVGNLGAIVHALGAQMAEQNAVRATVDGANGAQGDHAQLVVICGKNHKLRDELPAVDWGPHLHVVVEGFTNRMSDYMAASDCIVTKAGPGTIAEACVCALPIMLSGHLPGQESGNVDFVVNGGFGAYSRAPSTIAQTVCDWLSDDEVMRDMSERSLRHAHPGATERIADDIAEHVGIVRSNILAVKPGMLPGDRLASARAPMQATAP